MSTLAAATLVLAAVSVVQAHAACNGFDRERERSIAEWRRKSLFERQQVPDEASQAALNGSAAECTSYNWAPSNAAQASYPAPWNVASIVPDDTEAQRLFATINASLNAALPNVRPKGTPENSATAGSTYPASDPDCWWTYSQCTSPSSSTGLKPDIISVPEPNTWGYTFDDGPLCDHNEFYDYLETNNQKATMFYIGSNVQAYPLQAQRAIADGHHVCVHTWSHHYTTALSNEQVFAELYYTRQIIKQVLGVTTKCWRPPYGDTDNRVRFIANALNLTSIVWDDDTSDWSLNSNPAALTTVDANYASFVSAGASGKYATGGPIVLSHELADATVNEAMKWYPQIQSAFQHIVPIATAYNWTHPYVELNYTYPDFATYMTGLTKTNISSPAAPTSSASVLSSSSVGPARTSKVGNPSGTTSSTPSADVKAVSGATSTLGGPVSYLALMALSLIHTALVMRT